jgi:hypothetical protein
MTILGVPITVTQPVERMGTIRPCYKRSNELQPGSDNGKAQVPGSLDMPSTIDNPPEFWPR